MPADFVEADLKGELASLAHLLGDTRARFYRRETQYAAGPQLIDLDLQIRRVLDRPLSAELQLEVRRLLAQLRALDPH